MYVIAASQSRALLEFKKRPCSAHICMQRWQSWESILHFSIQRSTSNSDITSILRNVFLTHNKSLRGILKTKNVEKCKSPLKLKPRYFPPNRATKMRERHLLFFGLQLVSKEFQHSALQTEMSSTLAVFSSNRKTGIYANHDSNKQEVQFIFA